MNIPIFINSLKRATDRRAAITKRLTDSGFDYEINDAIDGAAGLGEYAGQIRRDIAMRNYGRKLGAGRCGNYLSHYELWQRISHMDIPAAIIMEDDAVWNNDFMAVAKAIIGCDWQWDVVNIAGEGFNGKIKTKAKTKRIKKEICDLVGEYKLVLHKRTRHYSMAYLITPAGAAKLAARALPMVISVDKYWNECWRHGAVHYTLNKPVAFHAEVESTLDNNSSKGKPFSIACTAWANARIRSYQRRWFYFWNPPKRK